MLGHAVSNNNNNSAALKEDQLVDDGWMMDLFLIHDEYLIFILKK